MTIAELSITLLADVRNLRSSFQSLRRDLESSSRNITEALKTVSRHIRIIGIGLAGIGAATALGFGQAAKAAIEFEKQMSFVATMVEDTDKWMNTLSEGVLDLSRRFGMATEDLSKALYDILSSLIPPADALNVLEQAARAAVAGMTDVKTAANALITVMKAYRIPAEKAADVSDWLFQVIRLGRITLETLSPQLARVAASAAAAGVDLNELGAAIATLTRGGLPASQAMTTLYGILRSVFKPTRDIQEAALQLGIVLDKTTIKTIGLRGVMELLAATNIDLAAKIFPNIRGLRGVYIVTAQLEDMMRDYIRIQERSGAAFAAYEKRASTVSFRIDQLRQTVNALVIEIGKSLIPVAHGLIGLLSTLENCI